MDFFALPEERAPNPLVLGSDGKGMHVKCEPGAIGRYVIVAGDPGRIPALAAELEGAAEVTTYRGYAVWTGTLCGERVSCVAHGIGGGSAAIVFEELFGFGAHTVLRIGTSGSLQTHVRTGDVVVSSAAIRDEGTTLHYLPPEVPVVASPEVVLALLQAGRECGDARVHCGITHCKDAFYAELPGFVAGEAKRKAKWEAFEAAGALATEMEAAALFAVGSLRKARVGACLAVIGDTSGEGDFMDAGEKGTNARKAAIKITVQAMRNIIRSDQARKEAAAAAVAGSGGGE